MKNGYGEVKECFKCGNAFIKTVQTGNQCNACRRAGARKSEKEVRRKKNFSVKEHLTISKLVANFVRMIDAKGGYITSLRDMNQLIYVWQVMNVDRDSKYDALPAGHQLHYMWRDLQKFYQESEIM